MTSDDVKRTLKAIIAEVCAVEPSTITDDTSIDNDLEIPSVAFVELQVAMEAAFDIFVDPMELIELNKFKLIAERIYKKAIEVAER